MEGALGFGSGQEKRLARGKDPGPQGSGNRMARHDKKRLRETRRACVRLKMPAQVVALPRATLQQAIVFFAAGQRSVSCATT
jgi:hypothetical protein